MSDDRHLPSQGLAGISERPVPELLLEKRRVKGISVPLKKREDGRMRPHFNRFVQQAPGLRVEFGRPLRQTSTEEEVDRR